MIATLNDICSYRNETVDLNEATLEEYVSTESMLPNRGGIGVASSLPGTGKVKLFKAGDTLISNIRPYFKKIWRADHSGYCSNDVLVFKADGCLPDFLYWTLSSDDFFAHMTKTSKGTKMPRGDKNAIMQYEISLLNLSAQEAVCSILNPLQGKISSNSKLNDYLAEMADALFADAFGDLEDNAVLSDIANITMGQSPAGTSYNEEGVGTVFYQGRGEFGWRYPTQRLFTTEPKRMAKAGDVLMSVRAPVGDLNLAYEDCCIGRGLAAISCDYPSYCLYLMRSLSKKLDAYNGEGTVFGSINGKALKGLEIALPGIDDIATFEAMVAPIDAQIRCNETESRSLSQLRDALLPKLMSGEIDVSKVDLTQLNNHLAD